jgi:hypothetical protein
MQYNVSIRLRMYVLTNILYTSMPNASNNVCVYVQPPLILLYIWIALPEILLRKNEPESMLLS